MREINKRYRQFKKEIESDEFTFAKYPSKHVAKKLHERAKSLNYAASPKGLFIQKEGSRRASIEWNSRFKEYQVKLTGKTKYGKNVGSQITSFHPLAKLDTLLHEQNRIRDEFDFLNLHENEFARFVIIEATNAGAVSKSIFDRIDGQHGLLEYIGAYHSNVSDKLAFMRILKIEKVSPAKHLADRKSLAERFGAKKRKTDKKGRSI